MNLARLKRILSKPPQVILSRAMIELRGKTEKYRAPYRSRTLDLTRVFDGSLEDLWYQLAQRPYLAPTCFSLKQLERLNPAWRDQTMAQARKAMQNQVEVLGSGLLDLGPSIDWHRDYKVDMDWPRSYAKSIDYTNLDRPSDVKVAWEISRMQWLLPLAQAYLLEPDPSYAAHVRKLLDSWIDDNPMAMGVNWACTMEVAIRAMTWTYLFHAFKWSQPWSDESFRRRFLNSLYLHGEFTSRHLEYSDINGNHYTADAAGLVFVGLFFGRGPAADWARAGARILEKEISLQVTEDGVDFEGSVPYHRLVLELFALPALYAKIAGAGFSPAYLERLNQMARYVDAYSREDGSIPLLGDADDGRALPLGTQPLNQHLYLLGLVAEITGESALHAARRGDESELFWLGIEPVEDRQPLSRRPAAFTEAGYYVLIKGRSHLFADCASVGLAERGGHGHNDCLSFEAVLDGFPLVTDSGSYQYTASAKERDLFRSTDYHNTPRVDGHELNPFDGLWCLKYEARPKVLRWEPEHPQGALLQAEHSGYHRLESPVTVRRTFLLAEDGKNLCLVDDLLGVGRHQVEIPLHFLPGVEVEKLDAGSFRLARGSEEAVLRLELPAGWEVEIQPSRFSPSYGVVEPAWRLRVSGNSELPRRVTWAWGRDHTKLKEWLSKIAAEHDFLKNGNSPRESRSHGAPR